MLYVSFVFFPLLQTKDPTLVMLAIAIPPAFIQTMIFAVEGSWYAELFRDFARAILRCWFCAPDGVAGRGLLPADCILALRLYRQRLGPAGYYLFTSVISLAAVYAGRETRLEKLER